MHSATRHHHANRPGASGVELEIDGNWTFVDTLGLVISKAASNAIDVQMPAAGSVTGIRYAWADNPCCGNNNRTMEPCPPMVRLSFVNEQLWA
jgi:hypothetical protein